MANQNDNIPDRDDFVQMHIGKAGSGVTRANFVDGFLNDVLPQQDGTPAVLISADAIDTEGLLASATALPQWQRLLSKLDNALEDASVVLVGDSTGDAATEWFYLLGAGLAALYPEWTFEHAAWNTGTDDHDAATTIAAGSGARVCTFYNGSVAGSAASYHASDNFLTAVVTPDPDLILVSYGHNGSTTGPRQLDYFDALASRLRTALPETPVIQIGQNPTLSDETMAAKIEVLAPFAARNGWGFINVHDAFKQSGVALATLLADSVHPNATGSALWCATVLASIRASRAAYGGGSIAPATALEAWSHPSEFDAWTKSNITLTTDTTYYETKAASTSLACTAPGVAYISKAVINGNDILALRGKWVTFWLVQRVPDGNDSTSGRIDLVDAGGTTTAVGVTQGDGFILTSVRKKIDAAATTLTVYIYPTSTVGVSNTIQLDRAGLSLGVTPVDEFPRQVVAARALRIFGGGASGIGVLYNSSTTSTGLRHIATATADVSAAWTSDFSSDGLDVKQAGDTYARARVAQGGFYAGLGTGVVTALRLSARFADAWGCTGHFYPQSSNTYDCGDPTLQWRRGHFAGYVTVAGNQVLGARGAAIAALTVTATVGSLPATNGSVTIADAATPTVVELLEYCRELEAKLEAALAAMRAATGHGLIA